MYALSHMLPDVSVQETLGRYGILLLLTYSFWLSCGAAMVDDIYFIPRMS